MDLLFRKGGSSAPRKPSLAMDIKKHVYLKGHALTLSLSEAVTAAAS